MIGLLAKSGRPVVLGNKNGPAGYIKWACGIRE